MEFDSRDQPDVPSSLPNTSTLQQQKGKGKSRSQCESIIIVKSPKKKEKRTTSYLASEWWR